jgi:hypothetical protein
MHSVDVHLVLLVDVVKLVRKIFPTRILTTDIDLIFRFILQRIFHVLHRVYLLIRSIVNLVDIFNATAQV